MVLTCCTTIASAQTATAVNASTVQQPPVAHAAPKPPDTLGLQAFGAPIGKTLADHGVYITGRILAEPQAQVSGGIKRGQFYEGYTALGADFDMNKIFGIKGGIIHLSVGDLQGQPYYNYTGSAYLYNRAWVNGDEFRLAEFDWEQTLFHDHVRFIVGRLSPSGEFDSSFSYCQFAYSGCANPAAFIFDKNTEPYLTSSWGGALTLKPTVNTYIKGGAFAYQPSLSKPNHNNWPGSDWGFNKIDRATYPFEIGYLTTPLESRYPEHYDIGGYYDANAYRSTETGITSHGRSGIYLQAEKVVWHPIDKPYQTVSIFGAANWSTSGSVAIERGFLGGFRIKGLWSARPYDSFGVAVQYLGLNHTLIAKHNLSLAHEGFTDFTQADDETGIDANYSAFVAPGIQFTPFVFYALNPEQFTQAAVGHHVYPNVNHSLTIGAAITVNFAQAFGLPELARHPF